MPVRPLTNETTRRGEARPAPGKMTELSDNAGALGDLVGVRQPLQRPIEAVLFFERGHEFGAGEEAVHPLSLHQAERERLVVVVLQHVRGDLVGHRLQQGVARGAVEAMVALLKGDGKPH